VRETVEGILAQVEDRKDVAIRELSQQVRQLVAALVQADAAGGEHAISQVAKRDLDDIRFAQAQVRNFAQKQKETMRDLEVETLPGVVLGHKHIPVNSSAAMCRAAVIRWWRPAHMSIVTAKVAGVQRVIACAPPFKGGPHPAIVAAMHFGGADEIYVLGGVQAVAAMALGTETISPVDMIVGPGNAYVAEAKRQLFGRVGIDLLAGPTETLVHRRRQPSTARYAPPTCSARPSTARPRRPSFSPIRKSSRAHHERGRAGILKILPPPTPPARPGRISARSSSATTRPRWCARPTASRPSTSR
jgi:sulfopropanediol 3-dehydrogenase